MRIRLMHPDQPFDVEALRPTNADDLVLDLGLEALLDTMAGGDRYLRETAEAALLCSLDDPAPIRHRLDVFEDCVRESELVVRLYKIAVTAVDVPKHSMLGWHTDRPGSLLHHAVGCMTEYVALLRQLRAEVDAHRDRLTSAGMRTLCDEVQHDLPDDYLDLVEEQLELGRLRPGVLETARLGGANEGTAYVLRRPDRANLSLTETLGLGWGRHTVTVPERDIAGAEELGELRERGLVVAAEAWDRSARTVAGFFAALRRELAFYLGCLNLRAALSETSAPLCRPEPRSADAAGVVATGLYDPLLVVHGERHPVGSDVDADGAELVVVTGANQGGKSTFLRALGLAQLMMQAGMYVAATSYVGPVAHGLHTHFKREEDTTMTSGKFDEELARMRDIVRAAVPGSLVLCNESFSATNEREAAVVGTGVVTGLLDAGVRVHLVTHYHALAATLAAEVGPGVGPGTNPGTDRAVLLRAERAEDGTRTHRIVPGTPLRTSYAADLFAQVFGEPLPAA